MWDLFIDPTPGYVSFGLGKVGWDFWIDVHVGRILRLFCTPVSLTSYIFHNNTYYWEQRVFLLVKIIECKWFKAYFLVFIENSGHGATNKNTSLLQEVFVIKSLRRGRDSNPRTGVACYSLSSSATDYRIPTGSPYVAFPYYLSPGATHGITV